MNIDIDINDMFSEKNKDLFLNKLILDLGNNTETFKLATKHIVMIEVAKLLSSLKRIYDKYSISYVENDIKGLLSETKTTLLEDVNVLIDEKNSNNASYVDSNRSKQVNKKYLKDYHRHIDESDSTFQDGLKLAVSEASEISLYNSLIGLYPCSNEEMQQDILQIVNVDFSNTIIARVSAESKLRSRTLKNISEEDYQKYLEFSKNSDITKTVSKVKTKADN